MRTWLPHGERDGWRCGGGAGLEARTDVVVSADQLCCPHRDVRILADEHEAFRFGSQDAQRGACPWDEQLGRDAEAVPGGLVDIESRLVDVRPAEYLARHLVGAALAGILLRSLLHGEPPRARRQFPSVSGLKIGRAHRVEGYAPTRARRLDHAIVTMRAGGTSTCSGSEWANETSWRRVSNPSFWKMLWTWLFTVDTVMLSRLATSLLLQPTEMRRVTCHSRTVRAWLSPVRARGSAIAMCARSTAA